MEEAQNLENQIGENKKVTRSELITINILIYALPMSIEMYVGSFAYAYMCFHMILFSQKRYIVCAL